MREGRLGRLDPPEVRDLGALEPDPELHGGALGAHDLAGCVAWSWLQAYRDLAGAPSATSLSTHVLRGCPPASPGQLKHTTQPSPQKREPLFFYYFPLACEITRR